MDGLKPGSLDGLVDIERGIVSREILVSSEGATIWQKDRATQWKCLPDTLRP